MLIFFQVFLFSYFIKTSAIVFPFSLRFPFPFLLSFISLYFKFLLLLTRYHWAKSPALWAPLCLSIGRQVSARPFPFLSYSLWVLSWYVHFIKLPTTGATSTRCWPVSSSSCALWRPHLDNKRPLGKGVTQSQSDEEGRESVRGMEGGGVAHHKNAFRTVKESVFIAIHSLWLAVFEGVVCVSRGNSFSLLTISRPQVQFSIMLFFPAFPRQLQLRPCKEQQQEESDRKDRQRLCLLYSWHVCLSVSLFVCVCACLCVRVCSRPYAVPSCACVCVCQPAVIHSCGRLKAFH